MIADGQTGWIAERADSAGLRKALMRALETPPMKIAEMGRDAAKSILEICDNRKIIERHMSFRSRLMPREAANSLSLPLLERLPAKPTRGPGVTISDVLADYKSNGHVPAARQSAGEAVSSDDLERFRQLVACDTERIGALPFFPGTVSGGGWNGRSYDPLATIRCLIGNPKISVRVFQQIAAELARR